MLHPSLMYGDMGERLMFDEAKRLLTVWGCEPDGEPFATEASFLWPVSREGRALMLKVVDPEDDEAGSATVLAALDGRGAVRLLEAKGSGLLMERVLPSAGQSLAAMVAEGRDDEATGIICDVIATLHAAFLAAADRPTLIPFERRSDTLRRHLAQGRFPAGDLSAFQRAASVADEMIADSRSGWVPLHGDIHHFNILEDRERGWLAIDPKGIWGPRAYEYANTLCNPLNLRARVTDPRRMAQQAAIIAERGGLTVDEVLRWTWLHGMLAASWSLAEPDYPHWLACAEVAKRSARQEAS